MSKPLLAECPPVKDRLNVNRKTIVRQRFRCFNLARLKRNLTTQSTYFFDAFHLARPERNLTQTDDLSFKIETRSSRPQTTYVQSNLARPQIKLTRLRLSRPCTYFSDAFHLARPQRNLIAERQNCFGRSTNLVSQARPKRKVTRPRPQTQTDNRLFKRLNDGPQKNLTGERRYFGRTKVVGVDKTTAHLA